jgi:F-type H+-transporting ATPase subunit b
MRKRALLFALLAAVGSFLFLGGSAWAQESGDDNGTAGTTQLTTESKECIELLEGGADPAACQEAPNPILPATNELLWGALAFIVLFGLFAWKGVPAVKGAMDARAQKISDSLDEAEQAKTDAEGVLAEYQRQLADARTEASRVIDEARAQAETVRRDLIAKAEAEVAELRQRNAEQVTAERGRVMGELQGQVASLAIELAEKVVESNLDRETNTRLIESYINSVGVR